MKKTVLVVFALLVLAHAASITAAEPPAPYSQLLLQSIQDLGVELHEALRCDLSDPEAPLWSMIDLVDLRNRMDGLTTSVETETDGDQRTVLEQKLEQLRGLLHNLQLLDSNPTVADSLPENHLRIEAPIWKAPLGAVQSPSNDGCSAPLAVELETVTGDTGDASNDGQASCGSSYTSPDVWFEFTAAHDGIYYANTVGSGFDTVLSTHGDCPGNTSNQIDCNDDHFGLMSSIRIDLEAGETILIRLAGAGTATGGYILTIGQDARIGGTITEADGGAPIEAMSAKAFTAEGIWIATDGSDSFGDYLVTGLNQGEYYIGTSYAPTHLINELHDDIRCPLGPPQDCAPTDGDPVATILNDTTTIDFALDQKSTVSGTAVSENDGLPIEEASVYLYNQSGRRLRWIRTDAAGEFTFSRVASGNHFLKISHPAFVTQIWDGISCPDVPPTECDPTNGNPIDVPVATSVSGIDFEVIQKGAIAGFVTDASSGLPIIDATIRVYDFTWGNNYIGRTQIDGSYQIPGIETGPHYLYTETDTHQDELYDGLPCEPNCFPGTGTPIDVSVGSTTAGIDIDLVRQGSISGTVTDTIGAPVFNLEVAAYSALGYWAGYGSTDGSGAYVIEGLTEGPHYVKTRTLTHTLTDVLFDAIPCPFDCDPTEGTPVDVQIASTTTGIDFVLPPDGGISGTVFDHETGDPITGHWVEVWHHEFGLVRGDGTDPAGVFEVDRLPAGIYFVATDDHTVYLDELWDELPCPGGPPNGCDPTKGSEVTVVAGDFTTGIDFGLVNQASIILIDGFESGSTGAWSFTLR